jgi:hypothetical protein
VIEFHSPANIFPVIQGADFDALIADIKANGLRKKTCGYHTTVNVDVR